MEKPHLAVFDIDGTLLPGTSCERLFFSYLVKNRIIGIGNLINFTLRGIALASKGKSYIISANKGYLRGLSPEYMENIGQRFFQENIIKRIPKEGIIAVTEHKMRGHKVVLLSGMPEFLLRNFSRLFKVTEFHGSVMEIKNDRFTGRTKEIFPLENGKVAIMETVLEKYGVTWENVTAFADHYHDRYLLQKAGQPVAVNPDERLRAIAKSNNWRIEYFDDNMQKGPD